MEGRVIDSYNKGKSHPARKSSEILRYHKAEAQSYLSIVRDSLRSSQ
jgi:hypothetical protein